MRQLTATVHGYVQGVGFRASAQRRAAQLSLSGWVANQWDGSVKVVAEGPERALQQFLGWLQRGPAAADVERVDATWAEATGQFHGFHIRG
ncbi:MAG: acylphosphatase [Chloroflexi bacterium]|nr:MAG: acylphosphatase [Chloroflexota bacterium]